MEITWNVEGEDLLIGLKGRLDTLGAMDLDDKLSEIPEEITNITFNFNDLTYVASAGLRVLYWAQEYTEEKGGRMLLRNVSDQVLEVLDVTGFSEFINIEE